MTVKEDNMADVMCRFVRDKETKNMVRYTCDGGAIKGSIYILKEADAAKGNEISVNINQVTS
tara:strand:- start:277 stop:462 length:186 start_codon:yes stop_codon:yes gene_type:complete